MGVLGGGSLPCADAKPEDVARRTKAATMRTDNLEVQGKGFIDFLQFFALGRGAGYRALPQPAGSALQRTQVVQNIPGRCILPEIAESCLVPFCLESPSLQQGSRHDFDEFGPIAHIPQQMCSERTSKNPDHNASKCPGAFTKHQVACCNWDCELKGATCKPRHSHEGFALWWTRTRQFSARHRDPSRRR
jgi:hypothetical protein